MGVEPSALASVAAAMPPRARRRRAPHAARGCPSRKSPPRSRTRLEAPCHRRRTRVNGLLINTFRSPQNRHRRTRRLHHHPVDLAANAIASPPLSPRHPAYLMTLRLSPTMFSNYSSMPVQRPSARKACCFCAWPRNMLLTCTTTASRLQPCSKYVCPLGKRRCGSD